ncbi:MAG: ABC transporter substrate-binding protein [Spirochaetaceae bacterium]|jgi:ABC-type glycerol-3-phosphate transport system substrate-binding protein|nr:ABC transporter substrate-binding protein [Spirochaetaceae bacterium]
MKKILLALCVFFVLLAGCSKKEGDVAGTTPDGKKNLVIWSFVEDTRRMLKFYEPDHPDVTVEFSLASPIADKLDPVLTSGQGVPDVFAMEIAYVRKYVESGQLLDITDVYEKAKDHLVKYQAEIATYNGKVYALSWQATPGAFYYRRSLAKKYLGTDDPDAVSAYFTDMDKFMETAALLSSKSEGTCVILAGYSDLYVPFKSLRKQPWVVNNKLVIDDAMLRYMDMAKQIRDRGYDARVTAWAEGWFAGMKGILQDENGKQLDVFGYFLPTWGLHYVIKANAEETSGDWGVVKGPLSYYQGGTWYGAYKNTKNPEAAKEFIRYCSTDDGFLEKWALQEGDLTSNFYVNEKIKDQFLDPFVGGQNHYALFAELAAGVDGSLTQGTDEIIDSVFGEAVTAYILGEKTKDRAIADFQAQINSELGY